MPRPLDRDLRALLYSEKEAQRRVSIQLWLRYLLPLVAVLALVAGITAWAAMANAAGFSGLAGAATMYLAITGIIVGWFVLVAGVYAASWTHDASAVFLGWTTRARGISAILFYRARSISDSAAHAIIRLGEYLAMIEAGRRGMAETVDAIWGSLKRKRHGG
jgi:hypothetical protein